MTSPAPGSPLADLTFVGIKQQGARLRAEIEHRLKAVLDHGAFINGPEIVELEDELKRQSGAEAVIACASGTDAIVIPLLGADLTATDAVFIPSYTYNATANAVLLAGATPVFVDVDPHTFNMCPKSLKAGIDAVKAEGRLRPAAVISVDLFGLPADFPAIKPICESEGLLLLSDSAQSFGGGRDNARVGALAPVTTTSFFPTKTLGGYGDGGAIFTNDPQLAVIWEQIRWHGTDRETRRESIRVGMNGRLDTFQATVLLAKLGIFEEEWTQRDKIARIYHDRLGGHLPMQPVDEGVRHAWGLFSVLSDKRDAVRAALAERGIPSAVYYAQPLHTMKAFAAYAPKEGCPVADNLSSRIFSIPIHPYMTEEQAYAVADGVIDVLETV